ncbi:hypothetical protein [Pseudalkalibacillus caeni]|uniref:hypothetical protein n=1 Tax=Exobacillus caeni TaxID=2574798 RepID=UPI001485A487|nr:hypothetical protein [Pseudalkalibacillus caeni]
MKISIVNININSITCNGSLNVGKTIISKPKTILEKSEKPTEKYNNKKTKEAS